MKKVLVIATALLPLSASFADSYQKLADRARNAAQVVQTAANEPDRGIPLSLLEHAVCVGTFPNVIRVGFIFGGRFGKGLISCRVGNSWSQPSFFTVFGGSWGLQIGIDSTDLVLVFVNPNAKQKITRSKFTLGADASVAAGPIGRSAELGTDYTLQSEIFAYSRTRGLFAGLTLNGAVMDVDQDSNSTMYGANGDVAGVLEADYATAPAAVWPYVEALIRYGLN